MIRAKNLVFCLIIVSSIYISSFAKIITLFSHGIIDNYTQAYWYAQQYHHKGELYKNERHLFTFPFVTFNYSDAIEGFRETSFGQDNEIARLNAAYNKAVDISCQTYGEPCNIILFGLSRGASTALTFAGSHKPNNLKALILESPFDSMASVIDHKMQQLKIGWLPHSYGQSLVESIFGRYKRDGISPINVLSQIPDIPILIVCSREDKTVPFLSSVEIYKNLRALGHEHTYILIMDRGKHARILQNVDGHIYQAVVHAFYKKYDLPCDSAIAIAGEEFFARCQPIL